MFRTVTCKELDETFIGKEVQVAGWVSTIRDHGGIVFIELRDMYGIVQLTTHDDSLLLSLSRESVISVKGKVEKRDKDTINPKIKSGTIEIAIDENGYFYTDGRHWVHKVDTTGIFEIK